MIFEPFTVGVTSVKGPLGQWTVEYRPRLRPADARELSLVDAPAGQVCFRITLPSAPE